MARSKNNRVYKWGNGGGFGIPAQVAGERIDLIREQHGGRITPESVVEDASDENSPLHPAFCWDNDDAARKYRLWQARKLIACVTVTIEAAPQAGPTRAFVSVRLNDDKEPSYTTIEHAMGDDGLRDQLLNEAMREAKQWRRRYSQLKELEPVFAAVDAVAA